MCKSGEISCPIYTVQKFVLAWLYSVHTYGEKVGIIKRFIGEKRERMFKYYREL